VEVEPGQVAFGDAKHIDIVVSQQRLPVAGWPHCAVQSESM
jgi:hypothetical protein